MTTQAPQATTPNPFATGGIAGVEESRAAAAASRSGQGYEYLASLFKDKDYILVRFVTDEPNWIRTKQHDFAETKPAPPDKPADRKWPEQITAICRRTLGPDKQPIHQSCYICDNPKPDKKYGRVRKASYKMWAIACVRDEVIGTQEMAAQGLIQPFQVGSVVGATDAVIEVDQMVKNPTTGKLEATGLKIKKKHFVLVNMSNYNFFDGLVVCAQTFGTMLDRDYKIMKTGEGTDTEYKSIPMDPITVTLDNGTIERFDLRDPKYLGLYADEKYNFAELIKFIMEKMSDEFYNRFFDTRVTVPYKADDVEGEAASTVPEPVTSVSSGELARMRQEMLNLSNKDSGTIPAANAAGEATPAAVPAAQAGSPMANFPATTS
jgi:hypothetical protein